MKKIIILLFIFATTNMWCHADTCIVDGIRYYFWPVEGNDTCAVYSLWDYDYSGYTGDIIIPEEVELKSAYDNVVKKYKVTWLWSGAFEKSTITSIKLPNTIRGIGSAAFSGVKSLTSIDLPESLTYIGYRAFSGSGITSFDIPQNVTYIGASAFSGTAITSISLPDNITTIGEQAFSGCAYLKTIHLPSELQDIGYGTFWNCVSLQEIEIPDNVTSIGTMAFQNCYDLQTVRFGKKLQRIGRAAFFQCTSLNDIVIPDNVIEIKGSAFYYSGVKTVNIGNGVAILPNSIFYGCDSLRSVIIGNNVDSIMPNAFTRCSSLKTITIPDKVKFIGGNAFWWCDSLTAVFNCEGVDSIGQDAFGYNRQLRWVELGSKLRNVHQDAFSYTDSVRVVVSRIQNPEDVQVHLSSDTLFVPVGTRDKYIAVESWSHYWDFYKQIYPTYEDYAKSPGARVIIEGEPTVGIRTTSTEDAKEVARYDLNGRRISKPIRGLNLIRMSNGTTRKVIVK